MKILTPILAVIIGIILIFMIGKNIIIKAAVEGGVKAATGLQLTMDKINVDFFKTPVEIQNLKLYNPKGFPEKTMCEIPEIYMDINVGELFQGKVHINEMRLDLKELMVIKNSEGVTNVDSLKPVEKEKEQKEKPAPEKKEEAKKGEPVKFQIDLLKLKVGRVVYKDYSQPGEPSVKEYNVDIDDEYKNIDNPGALVTLILVKSLMKTEISKLANLDMSDLKSSVANQLGGTDAFKSKASAVAQDVAEKFKSLF